MKLSPAPAGREGEGGRRGRLALLPPKCYKMHYCMEGREREGGGRRGREGGVQRHKLNVGWPVSLGIYMPVSLQAMVMLRGPCDLIHEYRLWL